MLPGRGPGRGGPGVPAGGRGAPGLGPAGPGRGVAGPGAAGAGVPAAGAVAAAAAAAGSSGWACGNGTGGLARSGDSAGPPAGEGPSAGPVPAGLSAGLAAGAGTAGTAGLWPLVPLGGSPAAPSAPAGAVATAAALGTAAAGAAAAGCAVARPSPAWPPRACLGCSVANASLSLRTTGASIVDDADRTNSPISWSLAITALLSTPNSFASSYTRTFATALPLLGPARPDPSAGRGSACSVRRQLLLFIAACSSVAHRNLSLLSPGRVAPALLFVPPVGVAARADPGPTPQDTRRACRSPAVPAAAALARTPGGAALARSIPGWDAGTRPGQAFAPGHREQPHSRLPPREASRT